MIEDQADDVELRRLAERLGVNAADRLDVERTAAGVLARLRSTPTAARPVSRIWTRRPWIVAAAVLALAIGAAVLAPRFTSHIIVVADTGALPATSSGDLGDLTPGQLQDVIEGLDEEVVTVPSVHDGEAEIEDLSEPELQTLLLAMED